MTDRELQLKAVHRRKLTLEAIVGAGAGHTGGGLSCMDILNVLYNRVLRVSPQTFGGRNSKPVEFDGIKNSSRRHASMLKP